MQKGSRKVAERLYSVKRQKKGGIKAVERQQKGGTKVSGKQNYRQKIKKQIKISRKMVERKETDVCRKSKGREKGDKKMAAMQQ